MTKEELNAYREQGAHYSEVATQFHAFKGKVKEIVASKDFPSLLFLDEPSAMPADEFYIRWMGQP